MVQAQPKARRRTIPSNVLPSVDGSPAELEPPQYEFEIVNAFWQGNRVVLIDRSGDTVSKRMVPALHGFFVRQNQLDLEDERKLRDNRRVLSMKREGSWWRVVTRDQHDARFFFEQFEKVGIHLSESDVHPVRRFLTDHRVKIRKPKRCWLDLEVDPSKPVAKQVEGHSRVLCWCVVGEDGAVYKQLLSAESDDAEEHLLTELWRTLLSYDQVCAWGGDDYDFPLMRNRSEMLGVRGFEPRRWLWLDHLEVYRRYNMSASESGDEKESMALDRVAQAVLGRGKHDFDVRKNLEVWRTDPDRLLDYNVNDTVLMRDIEARTGYLDLHFTVCETCNTLPDSRGTNPTNFVEGYMLKLGLEFDEHFPTTADIKHFRKYEGAYVMEPTKRGILTDVHVCDFASLYPSIIITWNMSPETLVAERSVVWEDLSSHADAKLELEPNECVAPFTGKIFRTDKRGLLPMALAKLLAERKKWKDIKNKLPPGTPEWKEADRRTSGFKIAANSFYGVQGSIFSRFHVRDLAESITQAGKWLIQQTMRAAAEGDCELVTSRFESVYGDTDSVFITNGTDEEFTTFVGWCNKSFYPRLLKDLGCQENTIKLSYEKKFKRLVMLNKKRYAGSYAHYEGTAATGESKPEIKGLEYKRGDTLKMAREMQYELVQMILFKEVNDVEVVLKWLRGWRHRIVRDPLSVDQVKLSNALGQEVKHYKRKPKKDGGFSEPPAHVRVALELAKRGYDVSQGTRIEYVVVDGRSPIQAIPVSDYNDNVDRFYMWENLTYPCNQRLLEAAYPEHTWKDYLRLRPTPKGKMRDDKLFYSPDAEAATFAQLFGSVEQIEKEPSNAHTNGNEHGENNSQAKGRGGNGRPKRTSRPAQPAPSPQRPASAQPAPSGGPAGHPAPTQPPGPSHGVHRPSNGQPSPAPSGPPSPHWPKRTSAQRTG
jgi:DNA polymerase I